jgi:hypothetical protein
MSLRLLLGALVGWLDRRQQDAVAHLIEESRILRGHVRGRIRLTDAERRRLAMHGHRLGRRLSVAKISPPLYSVGVATVPSRSYRDDGRLWGSEGAVLRTLSYGRCV